MVRFLIFFFFVSSAFSIERNFDELNDVIEESETLSTEITLNKFNDIIEKSKKYTFLRNKLTREFRF